MPGLVARQDAVLDRRPLDVAQPKSSACRSTKPLVVMFGAVLDAEGSRVEVGECAIVCEHPVLRATAVGDEDHPVLVGDHAFVGPHATLLGCIVEAAAYVATGATVLHGAAVGSGAVVAVAHSPTVARACRTGSFSRRARLRSGSHLAPTRHRSQAELAQAIKEVGFAARAFGVTTAWEERATHYREIAEVRSHEFAAHADDVIIDEPPIA